MLVNVGEIVGQDSTSTVSSHTLETGAAMVMLCSTLMHRFSQVDRVMEGEICQSCRAGKGRRGRQPRVRPWLPLGPLGTPGP